LAVLDGQRLDDLDLALGETDEHARQLVERVGSRLEAHALAALPGVVELQRVFVRDDLFREGGGERGWWRGPAGLGRLLPAFALEEFEGHGILRANARGLSARIVAALDGPSAAVRSATRSCVIVARTHHSGAPPRDV